MQGTLPEDAKPIQLRPGVQPAIAASADDDRLVVEQELISILQGPAFQGSKRSQAFLRFVVEEALAGRRETLKERTVGVAVLGKPSDYDTGADSTVRVRANEVRKRLAAHYDAAPPKAGLRIELPPGTYAPRFAPGAAAAQSRSHAPHPPPMQLRQLAAPTLIACFLALIAIRAGVESSDSFTRFWNHALAGRDEIEVAVDSAGGSISPEMADAAMPLEALAGELQVPVHIVAADQTRGEACIIRLSLTAKPLGAGLRLRGAEVFSGTSSDPAIWLWAGNPNALRSAAQVLASKAEFPELWP